ncbi:hypothetical protein T492DRAFT_844200 [Pavlovales sp. CCMP2436]|nr:hypothetical protein T492DRAFT_844200 [Pavlovales sp. CCMP2436]
MGAQPTVESKRKPAAPAFATGGKRSKAYGASESDGRPASGSPGPVGWDVIPLPARNPISCPGIGQAEIPRGAHAPMTSCTPNASCAPRARASRTCCGRERIARRSKSKLRERAARREQEQAARREQSDPRVESRATRLLARVIGPRPERLVPKHKPVALAFVASGKGSKA